MEYRTFFASRTNAAGTGIQKLQVPNGASQRLTDTPAIAIITVVEQATDAGVSTDANFSIGITDGTTHRVTTGRSDMAGLGTSNSARHATHLEIVHIKEDGTNNANNRGIATFSSWGTNDDSININWSTAPAVDVRIIVEFYYVDTAGTESIDLRWLSFTTVVTPISYNIGFRPSFIRVFQSYGTSGTAAASVNDLEINFGAAAEDSGSTLDQSFNFMYDNDGSAVAEVETVHKATTATTPGVSGDAGNDNSRGVAFDADGYDITMTGSGVGWAVFVLAIECDDNVKLVSGTMDTINKTIIGAGFTPKAAMFSLSSAPDSDNVQRNDGGSISYGGVDEWGQQSMMVFCEDANTDIVTKSRLMDGTLFRSEDNALPIWEGAHSAFNADGFTVVTSEDDVADSTYWALFIEGAAPPAGPAIPVVHHHRQRNYS